MGVFAYTELTSRLVSLETSRELFENDLLKKSEQVPVDQEQLFLLEDLYKSVEKIEIRIENMMHNKVNIQFLQKQMEKALTDIEVIKDKVRANGEPQMIEHIVALLMFVGPDIKEHRIQIDPKTGKSSMSICLKA